MSEGRAVRTGERGAPAPGGRKEHTHRAKSVPALRAETRLHPHASLCPLGDAVLEDSGWGIQTE